LSTTTTKAVINNRRRKKEKENEMSEADFEAALAASIADMSSGPVEIDKEITLAPGAQLRQHNTLDQFHTLFKDAIGRNQAPSSICGFLTIAHCRVLRTLLAGEPKPLPLATLNAAGNALVAQKNLVLAEAERAMASIHAKRRAYVEAHRGDFKDDAAKRSYLKAWVANYEISDELAESGFSAILPALKNNAAPSLHFVRCNEYPQLKEATHEEKSRIVLDQKRFGGRISEKGVSIFEPGDTPWLIERFSDADKSSALLTPAEWIATEEAEKLDAAKEVLGVGQETRSPVAPTVPAAAAAAAPPPPPPPPSPPPPPPPPPVVNQVPTRVFAMDLNGHFVAAVVALVAASPNEPPVQVVKLFNTTSGNYLDGPMPKTLHSFVFGGSAAGTSTARIGTVTRSSEESTCCSPLVGPLATAAANSTAGPAVAGSISLASVFSAGAVAELVAMGFAEEAATKALTAAKGNTRTAVEWLLAWNLTGDT
jgi:hypothetical protein